MTAPSARSRRVLIVTDDVLTTKMAGPAIRAWQMAQALSRDHEVVLATTSPTCDRVPQDFRAESCDQARFEELERWSEIVVIQGYVLNHATPLKKTDRVLVVDLYDPLHLETLELTRLEPGEERANSVDASVKVLGEQMARGDFFLCASEKQRDLWLGFLSAVGRVNPLVYDADPTLRRLIDVVPFGLSADPPVQNRPALRGVVPGIGPDDLVVLWGGGVYDWLDSVTLIRAIDKLRVRLPNVRLYFLGVRHPNPAIQDSRELVTTRELAEELGLTGRHVFFNDDWVRYEDRHNYLLEADVGVSLHRAHLETAFSARTRVLDYLWAGLPIVSTEGDVFADLVTAESLGQVVPAEDADAVEQALFELLDDAAERRACGARAREAASRFDWQRALEPVIRFCADAERAPDRPEWPLPVTQTPLNTTGIARQKLATARRVYREGGPSAVAQAARSLLRRAARF